MASDPTNRRRIRSRHDGRLADANQYDNAWIRRDERSTSAASCDLNQLKAAKRIASARQAV